MNLPVAITGTGQSAVGRRLGRSPLSLTVEAIEAAADDAGLSLDDIDGLSTWPGATEPMPGFSGVGVADVQDALGLTLEWFSGGPETAGQLGAVFNAAAAVTAGFSRHVVCFRTVWEATAQAGGGRSAVAAAQARVSGSLAHLVPYGALSAANWVAMMARRHFHEFGTTREQLAAVAITQRANAMRNPEAIYRDPLTLEQYLGARMVSEPLGLFDCDVPVDGSTAVVVSHADAARDLRRAPLRIESLGTALSGRPSWDNFDDLTTMAARDAAASLWARTDLRPADVDVAALYDGFSFLTLVWLEALGFCGNGESGPFVDGGARIALDGELPLNTGGGQLSAGRLHGYGHLREACLQLWKEAGDHQVPGDPHVAAVGVGGGPLGGCLLLVRD
ncbi:MAG: thiolase family protein [Actinomycetota bacterium]